MIYFFVVISLMSFFLPKRQLHEGQCCVLSIICLQHLEKCLACRKYRICWLNGYWVLKQRMLLRSRDASAVNRHWESGENHCGEDQEFSPVPDRSETPISEWVTSPAGYTKLGCSVGKGWEERCTKINKDKVYLEKPLDLKRFLCTLYIGSG